MYGTYCTPNNFVQHGTGGETDTTAVSEGTLVASTVKSGMLNWWLIPRCEQAANNCGRLYHRSWLRARQVTYLTLLSAEMRCLWKTLNFHVQVEEINFLGIH